jgi:hypothetical protein
VLLLLTILAILLFRRRRPRARSLYRDFSILQPMPSISLPNPFSDPSDLEEIVDLYSVPLGRDENPFTDDARAQLPWIPEKCVTRDAYDDRSDKMQVQSRAVRRVSLQN